MDSGEVEREGGSRWREWMTAKPARQQVAAEQIRQQLQAGANHTRTGGQTGAHTRTLSQTEREKKYGD